MLQLYLQNFLDSKRENLNVRKENEFILPFLLATLLSSCQSIPEDAPVTSTKPLVNELYNLQPPVRKVPIAVYKFKDLTGQRKSSSSRLAPRTTRLIS